MRSARQPIAVSDISIYICLIDIISISHSEAKPKNNWMRGEQACLRSAHPFNMAKVFVFVAIIFVPFFSRSFHLVSHNAVVISMTRIWLTDQEKRVLSTFCYHLSFIQGIQFAYKRSSHHDLTKKDVLRRGGGGELRNIRFLRLSLVQNSLILLPALGLLVSVIIKVETCFLTREAFLFAESSCAEKARRRHLR